MKLKKCEIVQQQKYLTKEKIEEGVQKRAIKNYAYILHDKDVDKEGKPKEPHWHICLQFNDSQDTKYVAKWFGIEEQYVSKSKSGHFEDMVLYLTHKNASEKFQYDLQDVIANFDYSKFIENNGKMPSKIDEIVEGIVDGTIREFNYTNYIAPSEFVKYSTQIDKAFKYRRDSQSSQNRNLDVIFITGKSGLGKTTLAKHVAKEKGYSFYVSGSDNDPFENYKGEDCVILDDLRGSSMRFSELIKVLDNNTNSLVRSRYHNKDLYECKLIIITSIYSMEDFYANVFSESDEPLLQLQRRCKIYINIENENFYNAYYFDKGQDTYVFSGHFKNVAHDYIVNTQNTIYDEQEMKDFLKSRPYIILNLNKVNPNECPF